MKSKWPLISSFLQFIFGAFAIITFLATDLINEASIKWIPTLILSVYYLISGIVGFFLYYNKKH